MQSDAPPSPRLEGHPLEFLDIDLDSIAEHGGAIDALIGAKLTGLVVRGAFPESLRRAAVDTLGSGALDAEWSAPNAGMTGGEIRAIGAAATPTFTAQKGPSRERYAESVDRHAERAQAVFGDAHAATAQLQSTLSRLFGGRPASPPTYQGDSTWAAFNFRALDPGQQIYAHHDNHYGLDIYDRMDADLDRGTLLSWFVTLQAPTGGGELIVYGLWGSDPNPPMLPTRFLDADALDRRFDKRSLSLRDGDIVIFDAGRHVHRVAPVEGAHPRLTFGGFMTVDIARTRLAFWS